MKIPTASETNTLEAGSKAIQLQDGRILGYAEYGCADGKVLFYFHGHPGARMEAMFLAGPASQAGIRLIGVDRPGMGLSSYEARRQILDWPEDVRQLADLLEIDRFSVVGFSGGGPYALACAYQLPDRLSSCGIIAGVGQLNPLFSFLSQWMPWLMLPVTRRLFLNEKQAKKSLLNVSQSWVEPDRKSLLQPGIKELMAASLVEGLRQGSRGAAYDGALLGRPWGFRLEAITFPNLYLWHGGLDKEVAISAARQTAKSLPHCNAAFYPTEGHISLIVNHAEEIVQSLSEAH